MLTKEQYNLIRRVDFMMENKVNYFAPTISPAPKSNTEIESLKNAIEYFKPYTKQVIIQPKFMGSYCCVYLNKDIELTKFQSRNGYIIKHVDRETLINCIRELHENLFDSFNATEIIVEGELLPWSLMGRGLIEKEYLNYYNLHNEQNLAIKQSNLLERIQTNGFKEYDSNKEYPQHIKRQYESFKLFQELSPKNYDESLTTYKRQLDLFGGDSEPKFEAFNLLKIDDNLCTSNNSFEKINQNKCLIINIEDSIAENHKTAYEYYNLIESKELEGVVVKPIEHDLVGIVPCFKVRTNNYLQLIYGVRFQELFNYYHEKRNVKWKMICSTEDYELTRQLIRLNKDELVKTNKKYKQLLTKLVDNEGIVKTLDSRL